MPFNLYEILVPCQFNDGRPVRTKFHKVWDEKVRAIAGGLTILMPAKGQWLDKGKLYDERVIPVRIACTPKQIRKIADITASHYQQIKIMFYLLATDVHIVTYDVSEEKPVKITFTQDYEGCCGRKALENADDPFEDVSVTSGEVFDAVLIEQRDEDISFVVNNKGKSLKRGDRLFTVPLSCLKIEA